MQSELIRTEPETPLRDLMGGAGRLEYKIHQHGFVALVDVMPRLVPQGRTGDFTVVRAARVSYGQGLKSPEDDRGLIRYMMRHLHTSPTEMGEVIFHMSMPIFVARQFIRHRTASVNEVSARYTQLPHQFYVPSVDNVRLQSKTNKQGGDEIADEDLAETFVRESETDSRLALEKYQRMDAYGLSRELNRINLPVSQYTQWYWKCDLSNILRFLKLRRDSHAQKEIRDYADAMQALLEPLFPVTFEAWNDYVWEGMTLSRMEIEALRDVLSYVEAGRGLGSPPIMGTISNKREQQEWTDKFNRILGLSSPAAASSSTTAPTATPST